MPLAFTGQEYVWRDVYNQLGVNDSALNDFFTGPAYAPSVLSDFLDATLIRSLQISAMEPYG
jgi:hypothetical protein